MPLAELRRRWLAFWFTPAPAYTMALFRISVGIVSLISFLFLWQDLEIFFTDRGLLPQALLIQRHGWISPLITALPNDVHWLQSLVVLGCVSSVMMVLGLFSRAATIVVSVLLAAFGSRNPYILNAGDALLRICVFWLIFSPAGRVLSLDAQLFHFDPTKR